MSAPAQPADRLAGDASAPATPNQPVVRALRAAPGNRPARAPAPDLTALLEALQPALAASADDASALGMASTLAFHLGFERVSIGRVRNGHASLVAVSDTPQHAPRTGFSVAMCRVMAESVQHGEPLHTDGDVRAPQAHRELVAEGGARRVLSVPVTAADDSAVFVFERLGGAPVDAATTRAAAAVAALLAPALARGRGSRRHRFLSRAFSRTGLIVLSALLALIAALSLIEHDYRVSAPARVEGSIQRVVVAPFDGYVESASSRAGDRVVAGQVLATLQDDALILERDTRAAERDELAKAYRRALGNRDRAEARVLEARMAQADAQVALLETRLARTRIVAPFEGVVLSGDLSRSLGAPVARGETLFEVAPLDGHRIVMQVDERDVGDLEPGMSGQVAVAALPDEDFTMTVTRVSTAAQTEAGEAIFLVEATLDAGAPTLRPGMEGVAKVSVEPRPLLWVVTHRLVEWVQLKVWSLLP